MLSNGSLYGHHYYYCTAVSYRSSSSHAPLLTTVIINLFRAERHSLGGNDTSSSSTGVFSNPGAIRGQAERHCVMCVIYEAKAKELNEM